MDFLGNYGRTTDAARLGREQMAEELRKRMTPENLAAMGMLGAEMTPAGDMNYMYQGAKRFGNAPFTESPGMEALQGASEMITGGAAALVPVLSAGMINKGSARLGDALTPTARLGQRQSTVLKGDTPIPGNDPLATMLNQRTTTPSDAPNLLPQYQGAAPDRTTATKLRYAPKKSTVRAETARDNIRANVGGIKDRMTEAVKKGLKNSGEDWYNTEELRDWFIKELGEEQGHAEWSDFIDLVGATSTGAKVPFNIRAASHYRNKGPNWIRANAAGLSEKKMPPHLKPPKGYGHKRQAMQSKNAVSLYTGKWDMTPEPGAAAASSSLVLNPKPRGFKSSLKGGKTNIAADVHFTRYLAMAAENPAWLNKQTDLTDELAASLSAKYGDTLEPYISRTVASNGDDVIKLNPSKAVKDGVLDFNDIKTNPMVYVEKPNDNEYKLFEDLTNELAAELGITGPQYQAAMWMGAADQTGVAGTSQGTFMKIFRDNLANRAAERGVSAEKVLQDFIKNKGLLAAGAGVGATSLLGSGQQQDQPRLGQPY
jgi:hypothetical protein